MKSKAEGDLQFELHGESALRYRPCFELASGGMGTVYLARAEGRVGFHRFVALKRVHQALVDDEEFVRMFLDEVRIASRITHPNVCSVFDFEARHPHYFIVMEYLMGEPVSRIFDVQERNEDRPNAERSIAIAARIIAEACEGLHAAHELRDDDGFPLEVVHRDMSPQNLVVTYDGAVKVLDFGLVRAARSNHKTRTGIVKGKFGYLAPEAIGMLPVDRRADVWGLGVILWELLTGHRLFKRDSEARALMAIAAGEVPRPSTINTAIPPALDAVVMRALSPGVEARYATARDFGRDLIRFAQVGARPLGMHDLSERMSLLFPDGRAKKTHLLEIAANLGADVPPLRASEAPPSTRSRGFRRTRVSSMRPPPSSRPTQSEVTVVAESPVALPLAWSGQPRIASTPIVHTPKSVAPPPALPTGSTDLGLMCLAGAAAVGVLFVYDGADEDSRSPPARPSVAQSVVAQTHVEKPPAVAPAAVGAAAIDVAAAVPCDGALRAGTQYVFRIADDGADPPRWVLVQCEEP